MSEPFIVGWDIGGAHLKAVLLNAKGEVINCVQLPCQLWKGLDYLERAILSALEAVQIAPSRTCHAITMTGELVDLFENRHQGVCKIAKTASDLLGEQAQFYAANVGFVPLQDVAVHTENIASTNWHASASALAMHVQNALFVDIGSTTTDIIAIENGKVMSQGLSDAYRMQVDSLVYTGVVRTPVMALAQKLPFEDGSEIVEVNVAAEYFATMADVYRLTGELTTDDAETADGHGKTPLESARRLARMIGHDVDKSAINKEMAIWIKMAFACRSIQMKQIKTAMQKQLKPNMPIIGAGAGSFLVKAIATDLMHDFKHAYESASMRPSRMNNQLQLINSVVMPITGIEHVDLSMQQAIEVCFPAYAVACLAQKQSLC